MVQAGRVQSPQRLAVVGWTARMGAVTAESVAHRQGTSIASARSQLVAAARAGLLSHERPLTGQPALYVITRTGLGACGLRGLGPCRVSSSNAMHMIVCAGVAAVLERSYPDHRLLGERELRLRESEAGAALASARLGVGPGGRSVLHRPDLVLCPTIPDRALPVAVEVELTIQAPHRLAAICRAWARARNVAGVLYLAPPAVERALERAIRRVQGGERIVVAPLDALGVAGRPAEMPSARAIPVDP
jgi:hypothetical protein